MTHTVKEVKEFYHSRGYKMVPLGKAQKAPRYGFRFDHLKEPTYDFEIENDENIGMAHGHYSGTYAIDIDFKGGRGHTVEEALRVVSNDPDKILANTLVVKTPKQGIHIIYRSPDNVFPPASVYTSSKYPDVVIDVKSTRGLTVFPPSQHPEERYGRYSFISKVMEPGKLSWDDAQRVLRERGFATIHEREELGMKTDGNGNGKKYDYTTLVAGRFRKGERRVKQKSLYIQKRIMGSSEQDTRAAISKLNNTCIPPFDPQELKENLRDAERYSKTVVEPDLEKQPDKKERPISIKKDMYQMADFIKSDLPLVTDVSGHIYFYADGVYHRNGELIIRQKCRKYWREIDIRTDEVNEIVNIIKDTTLVTARGGSEDVFDTDFNKIIFKNGTYDFKKNAFIDHSPDNLALIRHPVFYDPDAKCPRFDRFISSCFNGDPVRITQCMELMALSFIKKYIIQKGYILYGNGSNGKSTFLKILSKMLGTSNTMSIPIQSFQKSQFIGYDLRSKCANISADGGTEPITKTGFLKEVLGGDSVRCEQKYHNAFMFEPFITMIFTFNEIPLVQDSSDGFARKIQTIHWDQRFTGDRKDPAVNDIVNIPSEMSGIINKLVQLISKLLQKKALSFEDSAKETKAILLSRSDSWYGFETAHIVRGAHEIDNALLRRKYEQWCTDEGLTPITVSALNTKLRDMGIVRKKTRKDGMQCTVMVGLTTRDQLLTDNKQQDLDKALKS